MTVPDAAGFDEWYAHMNESNRQQAIQQEHLGLPPHLESSSLLPWAGIAEVVTLLNLTAGDVLVDLACGRGGYGLEVARRTGARLIGVDFSAVAIDRAGRRRAEAWADVDARFEVGSLERSGQPAAVADAVMCIDAMQFADPYTAGVAEVLRILRPGGRFVLTGWQRRAVDDESVPERMGHDVAAVLAAAGFVDIERREMAAWQAAERSTWTAAAAIDAAGDPALESMRDEGQRMLPIIDRVDRLCVSASAPTSS